MAMTAIRNTKNLAAADPLTIVSSVVELAQLGLEPNTPIGHAWILPFYSKKRRCYEAQPIIGYRGMIQLAFRSGVLLNADVVREHDRFKWSKGSDERVEHIPYDGEDAGPLTHAYAVATFPRLGGKLTKVIGIGEIRRAIAASATGGQTIEGTPKLETDWYWRKTAIRRIAPFLPLSAEFARAVELSDAQEMGLPTNLPLHPIHAVEVRDDEPRQSVAERIVQHAQEQQADEPAPDHADPTTQEPVSSPAPHPQANRSRPRASAARWKAPR
jgi:recombination protein RecT